MEHERTCERCAHNTGNIFSDYCRACCFGSKFETKNNISLKMTTDTFLQKSILNSIYGVTSCKIMEDDKETNNRLPKIKKVIFNKPATIVLWADGTKTVVKAQEKERFNKEKGLAMAIAKKVLGNQGNYYDEFKKWI